MRNQEKIKGNYSKLVYASWAFCMLKADESLFMDIGRNQVKHRHGFIEIHCSNAVQCDKVQELLGKPTSPVEIKRDSGGKRLASC